MNSDRIISCSAIFVSLLALFVSIWQGVTTREFNKLSVRPALLVMPLLEGKDGKNGVYLGNAGLGPAVIKRSTIFINAKGYDFSHNIWPKILKEEKINPACFATSWIPKDSVLKTDEEVSLIRMTSADLPLCFFEVKELLEKKNLKIRIDYQSMYGEKFSTTKILTDGDDVVKSFN